MNYELAKELKDAGFPQLYKIGCWFFRNGDVLRTSLTNEYQPMMFTDPEHFRPSDTVDLYVPTLEELIEACGANLLGLGHNAIFQTWRAMSVKTSIEGVGATPTEAVAHLWLALHKK